MTDIEAISKLDYDQGVRFLLLMAVCIGFVFGFILGRRIK